MANLNDVNSQSWSVTYTQENKLSETHAHHGPAGNAPDSASSPQDILQNQMSSFGQGLAQSGGGDPTQGMLNNFINLNFLNLFSQMFAKMSPANQASGQGGLALDGATSGDAADPPGQKLAGEEKFANAVEILRNSGAMYKQNKSGNVDDDMLKFIARGGDSDHRYSAEMMAAARTILDPSMEQYRKELDGAHVGHGYYALGVVAGAVHDHTEKTDKNYSKSDLDTWLDNYKKKNNLGDGFLKFGYTIANPDKTW